MTDAAIPAPPKRGRKPQRGVAKQQFSTRLPVECIEFLRSRPSAAAWLEAVIDRAMRRERKGNGK